MEIENVVDSTAAIVKETNNAIWIVFLERTDTNSGGKVIVNIFDNVNDADKFKQIKNNTCSKLYWHTVERWFVNKL